MDWDFFFRQLEAGMNINETCFYFKDDPDKVEHYLGHISSQENPYWVGYCDIDGGCDFESAAELVNAPIFNGRTLKERWDKVIICEIEGCGLDDWMKCFPHI